MPRIEWAGSPGFAPAWRLAQAIPQHPSQATPEETQIGAGMLGALSKARPIVCPPEQLVAIDDDLFPDLFSAVDYARQLRLPFEHVFFDFTASAMEQPPLFQAMPDVTDHLPPPVEIRGMVASENSDANHLNFLPIVGAPGQPPEEMGAVELFRDESFPEPNVVGHIPTKIETPFGIVSPRYFTGPAIQDLIGDTGPPVPGGFLGCVRNNVKSDLQMRQAYLLAASSAAIFRMALKVLYLLDSTNIELVDVELTRQERRRAERKSIPLAVRINVVRSSRRAASTEDPHGANFDHQFEVRGNFAHYNEDTQLYQRSDPEKIHPCPRCGTCRRIWRPPHIKGPSDKPLVVKSRQIGSTVPQRVDAAGTRES